MERADCESIFAVGYYKVREMVHEFWLPNVF